MEIKDEEIRKELSKILDSYEEERCYLGCRSEKEVKTLSWIEIAFEIGKLKDEKKIHN